MIRVVIAHLRNRLDVLALTTPDEALFLPLVALGELYKGAEKAARSAESRQPSRSNATCRLPRATLIFNGLMALL